MKKWLKIRVFAAVAAGTMVVSSYAAVQANGVTPPSDPFATRGEVVEMLLTAADDYQPNVKKADIMKGYEDGETREDQFITRAEAFTMISRAFGELGEPSGFMVNISPKEVSFRDVPDWAQEEIGRLSRSGALVGTEDGLLSGGDYVTAGQVDTVIRRIYALKSSNLKDDFYNTVNKNELDSLVIPPGENTAGGSYAVTAETNKRLHDLIQEIVSSKEDYIQGSNEQKIRDLYQNVLDTESRNAAGIQPLQPYLDAVDSAGTVDELMEAVLNAVKELGENNAALLSFVLMTDPTDSTRKVVTMMPSMSAVPQDDLENPDSEGYQSYRRHIIDLLAYSGMDKVSAGQRAEEIIAMDLDMAKNQMSPEEMGDPENYNNFFSFSEFDQLLPLLKPSQFFKGLGYSDSLKIQVMDLKQWRTYASYMTSEHLDLLKATVKLSYLVGSGGYLDETLQGLVTAYLYGEAPAEPVSLKDQAFEAVTSMLSDEVGQLYVARYFPPEAKAAAEEMVQKLINAFKTRVSKLAWMSETTRQEALKKLDSVKIMVGYPDQWELNRGQIKSKEEGGSYFQNAAATNAAKQKTNVENQFKGTDRNRFGLSVFTVNAAANRVSNVIIFPAGILQAPYFDKDASLEENLGGFGTTVAHEITHIFDDQGAQYDADGNLRDWWQAEDYAQFQNLCETAEAFYDGWEAAPGITVNGKSTLSENISDIGGVACALTVLSQEENPDYDMFFRSYASGYSMLTTRENLKELALYDEHAPRKLRVNRAVANFQEFYDTYGIKEGDGMYTAPEDRIQIW